MNNSLKFWAPALAAGALAALAGCNTATDQPEGYPPTTEPRVWTRPVPSEPAPARTEPAKPSPMTNVARMYFPSGEAASSALLVEEFLPGQVRVGQPFDGEIRVTNITKGTLQNVMIDSSAFRNWNITSSTPPGNKTANGWQWNLGDMAGGAVTSIRLKGASTSIGAAGNCLAAGYNNTLCAQTSVVQPALALTKTITPESLLTCGPITTTLEVSNSGTGAAENVTITDNLPAGLTTEDGKQSISIPVGSLAAGQKRSFPVRLKATKTGKYDNMATATADGGLTTSSQSVATVVKQPVLALDCKSTSQVIAGRDANFDITVSNKGDAACDVTISSPVPSGTTFVSANEGGSSSGGSVGWRIGNLGAGATKTFSVKLRPTTVGTVSVSAQANCQCAAPASTSCQTTVIGVPDIGTSLSDDTGIPSVGENHEFRYTVKNQGQVDLTNVKVVFTITDGLAYVGSNAATAPKVTGNTLEFMVGTVKAGQVVTFNVTCKGTKEGEQHITSKTSSDQIKFVMQNDEEVNYIAR